MYLQIEINKNDFIFNGGNSMKKNQFFSFIVCLVLSSMVTAKSSEYCPTCCSSDEFVSCMSDSSCNCCPDEFCKKNIDIKRGEKLIISFTDAYDSNCHWDLTGMWIRDPEREPLKLKKVEHSLENGIITHDFIFKARKVGRTTLIFSCQDASGNIAQTAEYVVEVQK